MAALATAHRAGARSWIWGRVQGSCPLELQWAGCYRVMGACQDVLIRPDCQACPDHV